MFAAAQLRRAVIVAPVNRCERMAMTLSAYNGGLGWVTGDHRLAKQQGYDGGRWFDNIERVNAGRSVSVWRENRHYPRRILKVLAPRYLTWEGQAAFNVSGIKTFNVQLVVARCCPSPGGTATRKAALGQRSGARQPSISCVRHLQCKKSNAPNRQRKACTPCNSVLSVRLQLPIRASGITWWAGARINAENRQLKGQIADVTYGFLDERGQPHAVSCVFTRGFVQHYNTALGVPDANDPGATATPGVAGKTPRPPASAGEPLRPSPVTQRDILANITDNRQQCRVWRTQVNGLLDYIEGLQP